MEQFQVEMLHTRSRFTTLASSLILLAADAAEQGFESLASNLEHLANEVHSLYRLFDESFTLVVAQVPEEWGPIEAGKLDEVLDAMVQDGLITLSPDGRYSVIRK